ncbi:hypothetical protein [Prochlorococcus sp. MIT 1341]|uniref:hypothetical protein n=1 Tax=Prochlorococcus sp. MIT 1341 TaxID=3096221 RepID=UPI002A7651F7|nr:hypothetical protein [Prochlorococcus sp. MIT 1341]
MEYLLRTLILIFYLLGASTKAGIDKFTTLDKVGRWEIERKIDSKTQEPRCRAFIPNHYAWFGGRIRLNKKGEVIIPKELTKTYLLNQETIKEVKKSLQSCEKGLIYKIDIKEFD